MRAYTRHGVQVVAGAGVLYAWQELLAAAEADPTLEYGASFRYDLVDIARQALQNLFAATYASLQEKCTPRSDGEAVASLQGDQIGGQAVGNYTEYPRANCVGRCLPPNAEGEPNGASSFI